MRAQLITWLFILFATISFAQSQNKQDTTVQQKQVSENTIYKLYPTDNYWTFIKLDTRNGKMWQVHFAITKEGYQGELILNSDSLLWLEEEINGRFTLHRTNNMYNFILLDQMSGKTYQVQWNNDQEKRFVSRIY